MSERSQKESTSLQRVIQFVQDYGVPDYGAVNSDCQKGNTGLFTDCDRSQTMFPLSRGEEYERAQGLMQDSCDRNKSRLSEK